MRVKDDGARLRDVDIVTARLGTLLGGPLPLYIQRIVNRELEPVLHRLDALELALGMRGGNGEASDR